MLFNGFVGSLPGDGTDGGTRGSEFGSRVAAISQSSRASYGAAHQTSEGRREDQRTFRNFHDFCSPVVSFLFVRVRVCTSPPSLADPSGQSAASPNPLHNLEGASQ